MDMWEHILKNCFVGHATKYKYFIEKHETSYFKRLTKPITQYSVCPSYCYESTGETGDVIKVGCPRGLTKNVILELWMSKVKTDHILGKVDCTSEDVEALSSTVFKQCNTPVIMSDETREMRMSRPWVFLCMLN